MKRMLAACLLLVGCGGDGGEDADRAASTARSGARQPTAQANAETLATIVGLYEGGAATRPSQLCITEGKGGATRFGLVVWGANDHSCSGAGTVSRRGEALRFVMLGDSSCTFDAPVSGTNVTLPAALPEGCAYYCGARASMTGVSFTQKGATEEDALKAKDLVGDPLCET